MSQDHRLSQINNWLIPLLSTPDFTIAPASSDASFRRYFRVSHLDKTWIVMDAPPEFEDTTSFVKVATFLHEHQINVPTIFAHDQERGFMLLGDFGNTPLLNILNANSADQLYQKAIDAIIAIQACPKADLTVPDYDSVLLNNEMSLFPDWYLNRHFGIEQTPSWFDDICGILIDNAQQQPQVIVHRDYHSRNLMLCPDESIGIIDFQDAVVGPICYDLVSLLRDCYIEWPQDKLIQWLDYYYQGALIQGLIDDIGFTQFKRWFDLMGLQRHLKVLGIFCRLNYRDGKTNYMNDLPLTLRYVIQVSKEYPEFKALHDFLVSLPTRENTL